MSEKPGPPIQKKRKEQLGVATKATRPLGSPRRLHWREVDTAHKLAKQIGWVGEKLAAPNAPPPAQAPVTPQMRSPNRQQCRCYHERRHPPRNRLAHGTGTIGGGSSQGLSHVQSGVSTGIHRAPRGHCHAHMNGCQRSKGLLAVCQRSKGLLAMLLCCLCNHSMSGNLTCPRPTTRLSTLLAMYDQVVHQYSSLRHVQRSQLQREKHGSQQEPLDVSRAGSGIRSSNSKRVLFVDGLLHGGKNH